MADLLGLMADEVLRHSGSVDAMADAVAHARSAVHEVTMDSQAYGQLCQFLPGLLSPIFQQAVSTLGETSESLRETAINLRAAVAGVIDTDASTADDFRQTHRPT